MFGTTLPYQLNIIESYWGRVDMASAAETHAFGVYLYAGPKRVWPYVYSTRGCVCVFYDWQPLLLQRSDINTPILVKHNIFDLDA